MKDDNEFKILDFLNSAGAIVGSIKESEVLEVENASPHTNSSSTLKRSLYKLRNQQVVSDKDILIKIENYIRLVNKDLLKMVEHNVLMEDGCLHKNCFIITQNRVEAPIDNSILFIVTQYDEIALFSIDNQKIYKIKTDDIYEIESKVSKRKTFVLNKEV